LLAEASELSVEFDELQQLGVYELQCLAWRAKAESAVSACSWLNAICGNWSDDGDDYVDSEKENHADEGVQEQEASCSSMDQSSPAESAEEDQARPPCVDVKEISKSSWWVADDIQARPCFATVF
jgi:hypothetical protein